MNVRLSTGKEKMSLILWFRFLMFKTWIIGFNINSNLRSFGGIRFSIETNKEFLFRFIFWF